MLLDAGALVGVKRQRILGNFDEQFFALQGAFQGRDEEGRGVWLIFGMLSVYVTQYVSCVFDHDVLEAATRGDEGSVSFSCPADRVVSAFHALVWGSGTNNYPVVRL